MAWASWALVEGIITAGHLDLQRQPSGGGAEAALDKQAVMPALMHFLSMVPELREGAAEGISGSALAGCEQDCAKLAFKALTLLHQVASLFSPPLSLACFALPCSALPCTDLPCTMP